MQKDKYESLLKDIDSLIQCMPVINAGEELKKLYENYPEVLEDQKYNQQLIEKLMLLAAFTSYQIYANSGISSEKIVDELENVVKIAESQGYSKVRQKMYDVSLTKEMLYLIRQ